MIVSRSRTVWIGDRSGMLGTGKIQGCFIHETRLLSRLHWRLNKGLYPVEASPVRQNSFLAYLIAAPLRRSGKVGTGGAQQGARNATEETISLRLATVLSDGFHQDADIENFTQVQQEVELEIEYDADFSDYQEVLQEQRKQHGRLRCERALRDGVHAVEWDYTAHHRSCSLARGARLSIEGLPADVKFGRRQLRAQLRLAPGERHHLCLTLAGRIEMHSLVPDPGCYQFDTRDERPRAYEAAGARMLAPPTEASRLANAVDRAREDLAQLYIRDLDRTAPGAPPDAYAWVPAAGIPAYISIFGRDDLTVGWQSALFGPELLRGALRLLRELQGDRTNHWRDEEPGRILHEAHTGPLSVLDLRPQGRYYGSFDASPFYAICLSEYYHWTGDRDSVLEYLPTARAAMNWMERYGHPGPRHFYSYQTRSKQGVKNQGWKDSSDAIVYPDARIVPDPIASCSVQGYAYEALLRMAELEWLAGERARATKLVWQAHELKKRFNDRFWLPDENYFAMALDPKGRQVSSISSDAGDALASGIVDREHVPAVVARLFGRDLFSGWGVRTLSADHTAFNPFSYHRGSVWPVENAVIGVGLRRFGFSDRLAQLLQAQLAVTAWFEYGRLPEVFSGHSRDHEHPFPAVYPKANSPQAWSAGVMPLWLQMLAGLYPFAPSEVLFLDPALPEWLPELRLQGICVGEARLTLRMWRQQDGQTDFEVEHLTGRLRLVRQPSPWSLFASTRERLSDLLESWAA